MKVCIVSSSDNNGGAAKAAYRLYQAVSKYSSVGCTMYVKNKLSNDKNVIGPKSKYSTFRNSLITKISRFLQRFQNTKSSALHSFNLFGSSVYNDVKKDNAEVVNIHWCNDETLSIKQMADFQKPTILTLHDMWAFCGSEHITCDDSDAQFVIGYNKHSEHRDYISGINMNKYCWLRKKQHWKKASFTVVTPSTWLSDCATKSYLFKEKNIITIPNALDTNLYQPLSKKFARKALGLNETDILIGFGAYGGISDENKGFDLLQSAIADVGFEQDERKKCLVFGKVNSDLSARLNKSILQLGYLSDEVALVLFYNAIDVMVVPSRKEAFGQTASEAHACGTPVVAFDSTGLRDVIEHKVTGYLAKPFCTSDLAYGINWCIENNSSGTLGHAARKRALNLWAYEVVARQYDEVIRKLLI